jgi:nitroreductase
MISVSFGQSHGDRKMEVLEAIRTRRSIHRFQDRPVPEELIEKLLRAAMSAPSASNSQPWQFVVITDRQILRQVPIINPYAEMAEYAPLAILICADTRLDRSPWYWPVDCAAAAENMLLAAHGLGLGAVWTEAWPREERMDGFHGLLKLPEPVIAHSLIVVGYPDEQLPPEDRYHLDRVHRNGWQLQS